MQQHTPHEYTDATAAKMKGNFICATSRSLNLCGLAGNGLYDLDQSFMSHNMMVCESAVLKRPIW